MVNPSEFLSRHVFGWIHQNNLIYNTCWEDPRLDRIALELGPLDTVLVITSAGCNVLDYCLMEPRRIYAVDLNPRQNALLELKLAGIRNLEYADFFEMFGRGRIDGIRELYRSKLRPQLSFWAREYWDRCITFFEPANLRPFYFRGTCGVLAVTMNWYINRVARVRHWIEAILQASTLDEQREIYEMHVRDRIWTMPLRFLVNRDAFLSMAGVPRAQREQVESQYEGGIVQFVHDCLEAVFSRLPLSDNYFWRVYLNGRYTPECCPEYLKKINFLKLKSGLVDRIHVHTGAVHDFLENHDVPISRFVLLDHMDWFSGRLHVLLEKEWQWIVRRATPSAKIIWRSGGLDTEFVNRVRVDISGCRRLIGDVLEYNRTLSERLHALCRVHTYGSFHIARFAI
jgi:S-adenosylmethionine-diacylglycerol 3-amino-3-carboxypropyl transferase